MVLLSLWGHGYPINKFIISPICYADITFMRLKKNFFVFLMQKKQKCNYSETFFRRKDLSAFRCCSAPLSDGGDGTFYSYIIILFRQIKNEFQSLYQILDAVDNKHVIIEKTKEGALP